MPRFFINRPIFAWVIAIMVMLGGLLAIKTLPVSQYPPIAPPQITINAMYPGASAQTVQDTVTQVVEQKLNGIDNLIYMSSTSDSAGTVAINLTFKAGTDPNIAQVQVQNKLQLATPLLPQIVQKQGIQVVKSTKNFLMIVGLVSEDGSMDRPALTDYLVANVQDIISRTEGVGEVTVFGSQNAMRIWLNPTKLNNYHLTTNDVVNALQAQNAQVSAGQFGGNPAPSGQQLNATITARTLLQTPEQFDAIILRTNQDGSTVKLKDVAECKIGTENYDIEARYKGKPMGGMALRLAAGANALDTANRVKAKMEELSKYFPAGAKLVYPYDTTPFVKISIEEVVQTLIEAVCLVFIIMFLFLQNFRATLIPTIAVPVVLLGTMGVLSIAGFSINTLTMFALVIVIGLLVDDAIVVVENVERIMAEEGLSPEGEGRWGDFTGIDMDASLSGPSGSTAWYAGQCPLIDGDRVILAPAGKALLIAVQLATGKVIWQSDTWKDLEVPKLFFGGHGRELLLADALRPRRARKRRAREAGEDHRGNRRGDAGASHAPRHRATRQGQRQFFKSQQYPCNRLVADSR